MEKGDRVVIHAITAIGPGEDLSIDYRLTVDGEITADISGAGRASLPRFRLPSIDAWRQSRVMLRQANSCGNLAWR
ncbi:hypothetical protein [Paraburkholderia sp. MM6662-R1]|uniref:hypothetical protein n=1 Tax=Paraburkholderia sp. MM6662-R1 TaxID=2991066 RepID=UPI003D21E7BD